MDAKKPPVAVVAQDVPDRPQGSLYPPIFAQRVARRHKKVLGALFGLQNFGVNLTRLEPGGMSSLRHAHTTQDEFIYVLSGHGVLITNAGETPLTAGMCAGFAGAAGDAHHIVNRGKDDLTYLEIGDRSPGDAVTYPDDDLVAVLDEKGQWAFLHKDGSAY